MTTRDELTAEERSILMFVEAHFEKRGMSAALAMMRNPETNTADIRAVVDGYREQWRRQQRANLKVVRR